jgi:hypothetical protein
MLHAAFPNGMLEEPTRCSETPAPVSGSFYLVAASTLTPCYGECNATSKVEPRPAGRRCSRMATRREAARLVPVAIAAASNAGPSMSTTTQVPPRLSPKPRPLRKHWRHLGFLARAVCAHGAALHLHHGKVGTMSYRQALRESDRFNVFTINFLDPSFRQEYVLGKGNLLRPGSPLHALGDQLLRRCSSRRPAAGGGSSQACAPR